jgi:hypothetical protein
MATDVGISAVLAFLHELFPTREIGEATLDAWALMFDDWTDDELRACAVQAAKAPGRTFFPTPGEIRAYRVVPTIDAGAVLRRISKMGTHNPNGWLYPRLDVVRAELGDAVASAYAAAGGERCFAEGGVSQDIACRTFATELADAVRASPTVAHLLLQTIASSGYIAGTKRLALTAG